MPSTLPLLSYTVPSQDDDCSTSTSRTSHGSPQNPPKSSSRNGGRKQTKTTSKIAEAGRKTEGRKTGKKARRPASKVAARKEVISKDGTVDNVEELVLKATAHAEAVQAVKKAVLKVQLFLLDGVMDKAQLQGASPLLTQSEYSDIVTERSIAKQCGYPLCQRGLNPGKTRKGRYRISLHEHKVYDLSETGLFCCTDCLVASKTFQSSLQIQRDDIMGREKLMSIVHSVCDPKASRILHSDENQNVVSNDALISGIQEREDSFISNFDDAGPFDAIEGYVPQNSIRHGHSSKLAEQSGLPAMDRLELGANLERFPNGNEENSSIGARSKLVSLDRGKSPLILDELKVENSPVLLLKSALKKGKTESVLKRNVSWGDQRKKDQKSERKDQQSLPRLKERVKAHSHAPQTAPPATAADSDSQETSMATLSSNAGSCVLVSSSVKPAAYDAKQSVVHAHLAASSVPVSSSGGPVDTAGGKSNIILPVEDSETQKSERHLSAEAVAAALVEASEAVVGGEIESVEAVIRTGLSIVPATESVTQSGRVNLPTEGSITDLNKIPVTSTTSLSEVDVRWPLLEEEEEEDDLDVTTARGAWHDTPPRNFKVEVSMFGTIWMALEEWISAATIAHVYGKEPRDEDEFVIANGREYRRQLHVEDSTSTQISRTFSTCLSQAFPDVVRALRLNVPVSTLEQNVGHLVRTMTFVEALPAIDRKNWSMILTLLLDGLSVHWLPIIGVHLANNMALLRKFLHSTGTSEAEYDAFRGLLLPLGRLPTFSTMCGG